MANLKNAPVMTEAYPSVEDFTPLPSSLYFFSDNGEIRSQHVPRWKRSAAGIDFAEISDQCSTSLSVNQVSYPLRSRSLSALFGSARGQTVYIDITGLMHAVWAPLLKAAVDVGCHVKVVYVEPDAYKRSTAPVGGQIYDLSTEISGIAPISSFAVLSEKFKSDFLFVPLLGFEGTRLKYLVEQVNPGYDRICPVIGVPGFKPWYVFETFAGNTDALMETKAWQSARYAPANCPFRCFYLLNDLLSDYSDSLLKIAPIGTKPHALGAIMFALAHPRQVEIVYDHPTRKQGRTSGTSRLFVYDVSGVIGRQATSI